jgi:acyl-CoA dehydrogenase
MLESDHLRTSALVSVAAFPHHGLQEPKLRTTNWSRRVLAKTGNAVAESENIVAQTAERIFADLADAQAINRDSNGGWKAPLWQALSEAGRFALSLPLAETMLAGWLLSQARIASPEGAMTLAPANPKDAIAYGADGTLSGRARDIPFAREAGHVAVLAHGSEGPRIALVKADACRIEPGLSLGGDANDTAWFSHVVPLAIRSAPEGFDLTSLLLMGAVARSLQIAGALESMLDISVRYAGERVAFEKKISKFQAVQHNLARLAGESAAALAAATSAADTLASGVLSSDAAFLEAAAAKIRCAEAAEKGAAIAHQVHGAIGFTIEHVLHRFSLRALAWRDDFGSETWWAIELGKRVAARGADELWPLVASR